MNTWDDDPEVTGRRHWPSPMPADPDGAHPEPLGLGDLLRVEAVRHEPDRDRILAAIREGQLRSSTDDVAQPTQVSSSLRARPRPLSGGAERRRWSRPATGSGRGRQSGSTPRRRLAWPLAAASVTVLALATVAGARMLGPEQSTSTTAPTPSGTSTLGPAVTIDGTSTPSSSTAPTTSAAPPTSTEQSAPSFPVADPGGGGQPSGGLADAVSIRVAPTGDATPVNLPRSGDRDWIVVGGRQDGVLVRAKSPSRPLGSVTVSGHGPSIVQGPYVVSWQGGSPEQSRSRETTWQSITAVDGRLRIAVPLRGDRFTVDLFAGTVKITGQVTVSLPGASSAPVRALLQPCRVDVCATVVSVSVDGSKLPGEPRSGELLIDLGPAHPGDAFGLGLAAVVLR